MFILSEIFNIVSFFYLLPFLKLNIIVAYEIIFNIYNNLFKRKVRKFKRSATLKTVLITGGTKGIGVAIIHKLVDLNYKIIILSRDTRKMEKLQEHYGAESITYFTLDLSDIEQVRLTANKLKDFKIDILINNAGVYQREVVKKNNVEYQFLVNHVSHYILSKKIKADKVVNVSSSVIYSLGSFRERNCDLFMDNYAQSKLANIMHSLYLKGKGVNACAVHPGIVCTGLFDTTVYGKFVRILYMFAWFIFTDVNDAADNVIYAALTEDVFEDKEDVNFYMYLNKARVPSYVNISNAKKLIRKTKHICRELE